MNKLNPELMTISQTARYLGLTRQSIYSAIRTKRIDPIKHGPLWYFTTKQVEEYKHKKYNREETRNQNGNLVFDKSKCRYSVKQVAEIYQVSKQRIYHLIRAGHLKPIRVGATYVLEIYNIEALRDIVVPYNTLNLNIRKM